jgi:predicted aldo/keto reductase-like oxidoreductase
MQNGKLDRRDFFKQTVLTGAGAGVLSTGGALAQSPASVQVPRTKLGKTGAEIPILGMGGSQKFDARYDRRLHRALAAGINYFDSSERYSGGQSHKSLAAFFKQVGDRKKYWITSKVSPAPHPANNQAPPEHFKTNLDRVVLEQLKVDYLDMFFMHGLNDLRFLEPEFIKMADDLKKAGKIKFFGFSCHDANVPELLTKAAKVGGIDAIMLRYNFRTYGDSKLNRALDAAKEAGIGLLAMKTMGSIPEDHEKVVEFQSRDFTLPQAKLKSIWADDRIDICVSEMENIQMVTENSAAAISSKEMAATDLIQLNRLAATTSPYYCLGCSQTCESRIDGNLKVADTLRYLMYHESYRNSDRGRELYQQLSASEKDLAGVDLSEATAACPQGIDIAQRLTDAKSAFA